MPRGIFFYGQALYNESMIRKATPQDLPAIEALCATDSSRLLFIDGDIEQNGLETDYQETWIDRHDDRITGIFLRYHTNFVFALKDTLDDIEGFEALIDDRIHMISSTQKDIDKLPQSVKALFEFRTLYFCECKTLNPDRSGIIPEEAGAKDAQGIVELLSMITEFVSSQGHSTQQERTETMKRRFEEGKIRSFVIKEDGKIVAHASTSAESKTGAMVVAVATHPDYRKKGYAKAVVSALTDTVLKQGKTPCLFYDNPEAGKIYHDLGYVTFDLWCMGSKKS